MTDDDELAPQREAAVRRLLGSVGSTDVPELPPEVAARLDATLADLVAARPADEPLAPVVALSNRRRKAFAAMFVAAAAVVVAGIGVPLVHDHTGTQQTASSEAALSRAPSEGAAAGTAAGTAPGPRRATLDRLRGATNGIEHAPAALGAQSYEAMGAGTVLDRRRLRTDLVRLRRAIPQDATYAGTRVHAPAGFTCAGDHFGRGYLIGVRYAGAPAVAAFRSPAGSTQVVEVLQCDTAAVLRSITLPTP